MKVIKPNSLGFLSKPFRYQGKDHLCLSVLGFFQLGKHVIDGFLPENLQWPKAMAALDSEQVLDEAMPKMRGEALMAGHCYSERQPARDARVRFRVGPIDKSLRVVGDRRWQSGLLPLQRTIGPETFESMPLTWCRAYGGKGFKGNPRGRGYVGKRFPALFGPSEGALPNYMYPGQAVDRPARAGEPAGFGPMDIRWAQRQRWAGTYDRRWLERDFPGLPGDMDWRLFNTAPVDQQIAGFWNGGEVYSLDGVHPSRSSVKGTIPDQRIRLFVSGKTKSKCQELATCMDTLWFFPDQGLGLVVHRAWLPVSDPDGADVQAVLIAFEQQTDPARPKSHYEQSMARRLDPETARRHALDEADLRPSEPNENAGKATSASESLQSDRISAILDRMQESWNFDRAAVEARIIGKSRSSNKWQVSSESVDSGLGQLIDRAQAMAKEAKKEAEEQRSRFHQDPETRSKIKAQSQAPIKASEIEEQRQNVLSRADSYPDDDETEQPPSAGLSSQQRAELEARGRRSAPNPLRPDRPLHRSASVALRQWVTERIKQGDALDRRDLAGADLHDMDFSGLDLGGIQLERADLSGACFDDTSLKGAVLTSAVLDGASFRCADLRGANLCQVRGEKASLASARLDDALMLSACLPSLDLSNTSLVGCIANGLEAPGARFCGVEGVRIQLSQARLPDSDWRGAVISRGLMTDVDLSRADLAASHWTRTAMPMLKAEGSHWRRVKLDGLQLIGGADLCGADFSNAIGTRCGFRGASLQGACFQGARLHECDFGEANLRSADLTDALLHRCLLMSAKLNFACLVRANLFQSLCRKTDFSKADLASASLVQSDISHTRFLQTRLEGCRDVSGMEMT